MATRPYEGETAPCRCCPQEVGSSGAAPGGSGLHLVTLPPLLQMHPQPKASFKSKPNVPTHTKAHSCSQWILKSKKISPLHANVLFPLLDESIFKLCPREALKIRYGEIHAGHSPSAPPPSQTAEMAGLSLVLPLCYENTFT